MSNLPELRIAIMTVGTFLYRSPYDNNVPAGPAGPIMREYLQMFPEFNQSLVWCKMWFGKAINGSEITAILKLMRDNQTDMSFFPLPLGEEEAKYVDEGYPSLSNPVIFMTVLNIGKYNEEVLKQLFHFSAEIVIVLILTIYCFARVLSKSEGMFFGSSNSQTFIRSIWSMLEMLLNQTQVDPSSFAGKVLVTLTAIGVFFWLQLWQSQMKTELSGYDTSRVAAKFDDILRLKLKPHIFQGDFALPVIQDKVMVHPESPIARIYAKTDVGGFQKKIDIMRTSGSSRMSIAQLLPPPEQMKKGAIIFSQMLFDLGESILCLTIPPEMDFLLGREKILETLYSHWYNKRMENKIRKIINTKTLRITESGIRIKVMDKVNQINSGYMRIFNADSRISCTYESLDKYMDKLADESPLLIYVRMTQLDNVFLLFISSCLVSWLVLMIERSGYIEAVAMKYRAVAPEATAATFARKIAKWHVARRRRVKNSAKIVKWDQGIKQLRPTVVVVKSKEGKD